MNIIFIIKSRDLLLYSKSKINSLFGSGQSPYYITILCSKNLRYNELKKNPIC